MPQGRRSQLTITLTPDARRALLHSTGTVLEARGRLCVLLRADGVPITAIAAGVGLSRHKVYDWLKRYQRRGLAGCYDQRRNNCGPPRLAARALTTRIRAVLAQVAPGSLPSWHLADRLGEPRARVAEACAALTQRRVLVRCARGRYALKEPTP